MFTYTPRNQLSTYTLPDVGSGPAVEERFYDDSKRLEEVRRPDGKVIGFEYKQSSNRLEKILSPRGETRFAYNSVNGLVSEIEEPDGQKLSFEYNGLLLQKTTWTGEVNGSVERTYDENFRVKTLSVNGENPVEYVYDDDNLLVQVGEMTITRDPESGRELTTQLGNVTTERTYTPFGEPETYTARFAGSEIYFERLTYNKLGWITDIERRQNGWNENLHYEYDQRGRLEEVWRDGNLESSYTYDDNSNRLSYSGPLGNATGTYDNRDRLLTYGVASFSWTEAGELLTKTEGDESTTYDYDVFGNLREVDLPNGIEIEYLTDGAQRRIGKKVKGVLVRKWLYQDQLEPIAELDGTGSPLSSFVYGTDHHVPDYLLKNSKVYRFLVDNLGSPRLLVDQTTGVVAQDLRFDEFGRTLLDTAPGFQPFGFAGGLAESSSGLIQYGARDFDPLVGRWLSRDPTGFSGSFSSYSYASNNPINFLDPWGLAPVPACVQTALGPYFPDMDWSKVELKQGIPTLVKIFNKVDPAAITHGSSVYFGPGVYDLTTHAGIGLIGHELTHVEQYREFGKKDFLKRYLGEYRENLKKYHDNGQPYTDHEAYEAISFERAAREKESALLKDLANRYPNDPTCGCGTGAGKN